MSCTLSVRICVQNFAIVWLGVWEEIGHRQNKLTQIFNRCSCLVLNDGRCCVLAEDNCVSQLTSLGTKQCILSCELSSNSVNANRLISTWYQWFLPHLTLLACECAMFSSNCLVQAVGAVQQTRGDQKVLGVNYVQNKIKIVFASYSSKAQNTTCTIWLWAINILCILAVVSYPQSKWGKVELCSVMKWQLLPIRSLHCMPCCSDSELKWWIHVSSWITSCEINFCWVTFVSFEKFFRNLCSVLVLASGHASDRHFSHTLKCTKYL